MRVFILAVCMFWLCNLAVSQYGPQYSLYMHDRYAFNPAFGGMERSLAAGMQYRSQWAGLRGHPESRMVNVHMPVYRLQGAFGLQMQLESAGAGRAASMLMSYNYIYESSVGLFSLGLRAGIAQKSLDGSKLRAPDGTYEGPVILHHDARLPDGPVSGLGPVLEAGLYYAGNTFETGLSVTGYHPGGFQLDPGIGYRPRPVMHLFAEYFLESFEEVSLYPVFYVKSDLIQTQAEVALWAEWRKVITAGLGYRGFGRNSADAVVIAAGVRLSPKFFLHYGYDIGISGLRSTHEGVHEILLRYNLGKRLGAGLPPRVIYNPRHL